MRFLSARTFVLALLSCLALPGVCLAGDPKPAKLSPEAIRVRDMVKKIMPKDVGVRITKIVENTAPDHWLTNDKTGILVEIYRGSLNVLAKSEREKYTCRIWFLPHEWIGILPIQYLDFEQGKTTRLYWADTHKIYINCPSGYPNYFRSLKERRYVRWDDFLWEKSLAALEGKHQEMERKVESLLKEHCSDDSCRSESARSLSIMRVPAVKAFIRCANNSHKGRRVCIHSLGFVGGREAEDVLKRLIENPNTTDAIVWKSSESLVRKLNKDAGPWVTTGLEKTRNLLIAEQLIGLLLQIGYKESAPVIFKWLKMDTMVDRRHVFINALAVLEYEEARDHIRKICPEHNLHSEGLSHNREFSVSGIYKGNMTFACRNYLGPWGERKHGVRFQLIPPQKVRQRGKRKYLVFLFHNTSGSTISVFTKYAITFIVDGKELPVDRPKFVDHTGSGTLSDRSFHVLSLKLPKALYQPGKHKLQAKSLYREAILKRDKDYGKRKPFSGTIYSNVVEIEVVE